MGNVPAEIIKEYRVQVSGLDYPIYGRIVKGVDGDSQNTFLGELSHYCKQSEDDFDAYRPSLVGQTEDRVEYLLIRYLKAFTDIAVVKNDWY